MRARCLIAGIAVLCLVLQINAQEKPDRFKERLEPVIKQVMQTAAMPGLAIAIVEDQKIVYSAGFGVKNLNAKDPILPTSLFHMASVTKPFVATSIMQLWERGKIDLDATVVSYLPYFKLKDERYKQITVRQMLSHLSGMPDVQDYEWDKPQYDDGALERYVRSLGNYSLIGDPGAQMRYSNMAYEVLGDVIAKVSGLSFEEYVRRNILEPLSMTSSTLLVKQADPALLTTPHVQNRSYQVEVSKVFPYNRMHSPSSTLYSNVLNMTRWAIANMNRGELDGKRILKTSTYDIMWKPAGEKFKDIGISWFLGKHRDQWTVRHSGGDVGFNSNLVLMPDRKIAVVMMSNYDRASLGLLTGAALDVALGLQPEPVSLRKPVDSVLYNTIATQGIDAAVKQYYQVEPEQLALIRFAPPRRERF